MRLRYWCLCLFFNRTKVRDVINITGRKLEEHIELVREKLTDLDFDMERLAVEDSEVVTTPS